MKKKRYCFFLFVLVVNNSLFSQLPFNGLGSGTAQDPFQIWSESDLIELNDTLSAD